MRKEESEQTKDCEKNCREDASILDEISVTDTDNRGFVLQDVIEEFYDLMIEKVLNYIGAE